MYLPSHITLLKVDIYVFFLCGYTWVNDYWILTTYNKLVHSKEIVIAGSIWFPVKQLTSAALLGLSHENKI